MKKLTLIALLLCSMANAQEFFISLGNDPNMITRGAYPKRGEENVYGMHNKLSIGFELEDWRAQMSIESFAELGFTKWTYARIDRKFKLDTYIHWLDIDIRNINGFIGLEIGQVKRRNFVLDYTSDNYREYEINPILFGANAEIVYHKPNSFLGAGLQLNTHQAEDKLKPYKKYRWQIYVNVYLYL